MKKMGLLLICVFPALLVFCRDEDLKFKDSLPWTIYIDVSYGNDAQQKMDIYLPPFSNSKTITLVIIHGGGWYQGDKSEFNSYVAEFRKRLPDYAIANLNYRLVKNDRNYFPTQENDIMSAVEFLKSNADAYHISTNLVLFGMSAGGHLALLHGYKHDDPASIKGIISFFGPADLLQLYGDGKSPVSKNLQTCIHATPETNPKIYTESNPIDFITSRSAPTLILHGNQDTIIPIEQAYRLRDRLVKNGVVHKLVVYPGRGHGFTGNELIDSYQQVAAFIKGLEKYSRRDEDLKNKWRAMHESKKNALHSYNDLKFGMFIHWGVYSKMGGVWKGIKIIPEKFGPQATLGEWIMYSARISREEYRSVARKFNPVQFDADRWVKLANEAGMKYIIAMAKHHDGFSMYHSNISNYNIYDLTVFKRDPINEIYKACKKYGLRLGLYYSHSIDWMDGGDAGIAQAKLPGVQHDGCDQCNNWDPSPVSFDHYLTHKAKPQVKEILTKFPGLLEFWFDYPSYMNLQQSFDFCKLVHDYQPQCLINSRVGNDLGDVLTAGDNEIPNDINGNYTSWETPGTLNNTWGYKSYDHDWKSFNEMLFWIVEIASKGGNYLLNIGPDGNGTVPEASVKILQQIGVWMKQNGEAIYGTTRWTTMKEGPTSLAMKGTGERRKNGFNTTFTNSDFWFTVKDKNIYLISLASSTGDKIWVNALFPCATNIKRISRLEDGKILVWRVAANRVEINQPVTSKKNLPGFVLKIEMK